MSIKIEHHPWKLIENGFHPDHQRAAESLFSIGNGRMGQRANFEEHYSGDSLQGNYLAGIYYPDKTRVGWWKNGYPEYFAKVINAVNWIGIDVEINGQTVDLANARIYDFHRELNMKEGYLSRTFTFKMPGGEKAKIQSRRFLSMKRLNLGAISYAVEALNFSGEISLTPYLDFDVVNEDSNYDQKFWTELDRGHHGEKSFVSAKTKRLDFRVCAAMKFNVQKEQQKLDIKTLPSARKKFVAQKFNLPIQTGETVSLEKYVAITSNFYYSDDDLLTTASQELKVACESGFSSLLKEHSQVWAQNWKKNDIEIDGDVKAQQGIRFNIFQLFQTYTGEDERLNIGPKGFTGEKYGGSTYWDTEAYCLPFYMATAGRDVARQLLVYRHRHLHKAIQNAEKLGFSNGAALYPMVTMNGEECHNEWEITFEEIHRNGAIAYAIFNYIRYTGDKRYLIEYGVEVLLAIARFWAQRVQYSEPKQQYVILGVTGPNEYENNVNNNWYTNYIARWCLQYALSSIQFVKENDKNKFNSLIADWNWQEERETSKWLKIIENMYLPYDPERSVFLQQEGFLEKEIKTACTLDANERPINQHWSWDRILRSCYIKQADVLQGLYFFYDHFEQTTIKDNFTFYEPLTVHESSLSPCIHSVLASRIGNMDKAYEMYLRTARLDLDDYNNEVAEGCHITSMAGTWLAIIEGFAGMRVTSDLLHFSPKLPKAWESYSFRVRFRSSVIEMRIDKNSIKMTVISGPDQNIVVFNEQIQAQNGEKYTFSWPQKVAVNSSKQA
ncbi:MAG: glycoside hydrolase family 65 protein [Bacteroidetes bacterium]|jgi:maltose phosphorylase|nr:glycoside hydrolase family 65 protein [Bacteroidota bacterium]